MISTFLSINYIMILVRSYTVEWIPTHSSSHFITLHSSDDVTWRKGRMRFAKGCEVEHFLTHSDSPAHMRTTLKLPPRSNRVRSDRKARLKGKFSLIMTLGADICLRSCLIAQRKSGPSGKLLTMISQASSQRNRELPTQMILNTLDVQDVQVRGREAGTLS